MAEAGKAPTVKLLCGMIGARKEWFDPALAALVGAFGPADLLGDIMNFDFTHYYDDEMGSPLYRRFVSFDRLVGPEALVEAKLLTNQVEREFAARLARLAPGALSDAELAALSGQEPPPAVPKRPINLDPGYIEPSKFVLASMKNFSHRLYLGRGVYGEVTLQFHKGRWDPLPWTFPDYASGRYHPFLTAVRDRLRQQMPAKEARG